MLTLALFGTSADPPTIGHQMILHWLSQNFDQVAVWAADNPFKSHQTPLEHRMAMLRLLIETLGTARDNVHLYPELSHPRTLMTVAEARYRWPTADLSLVVGSDLIPQLPRWFRVEELLEQVRLLVVPRPGYPLQEEDLQVLRQRGARVTIANLTGPNVSSTAYREHGDYEGLSPSVEAYIHREQLYTCRDGVREKLPVH